MPHRFPRARGFRVAGLLGVLSCVGVLWGSSGCGDRCEDLQLICDRCRDPNLRGTCEDAVTAGDASTCDDFVRDYQDVCPE